MFLKIDSADQNKKPEYYNVDLIQSFREYVPNKEGDIRAEKGVKSVIYFKITPMNPKPEPVYTTMDVEDILAELKLLRED